MSNIFLKEYSKEEAKALKKAIKDSLKALAKDTTPAETEAKDFEFEVIATTEGIDRDGEMVKKDGWDFTNFIKNPVLLWAHKYDELPIGKITEVVIEDGNVIARGVFAQTEFAQEVKSLYDQGILRAVSVGFIPKEREGNIITKQELLELSFVAVPSNPDALTTSKELQGFMTKWFKEETIKTLDASGTGHTTTKTDVEVVPETLAEIETKDVTNAQEPVPNLPAAYPRAKKEENALVIEKEGRVLSSKNRSLLQNAIDALQAVIDASEAPPKNIQEDLVEIKEKAQAVDKTNEELIRLVKAGIEKMKQ